jgi:hypothetical protein
MSWTAFAACKGNTTVMFSTDAFGERVALALCAGCGVREACLADALTEERDQANVFGVYGTRGGMTAAERIAALQGLAETV